MTIYFYGTRSKYGCFSNFSGHGFELDGVWWPTNEHFFQAQKFAGTPHADAIQEVKNPKDAARMGRVGEAQAACNIALVLCAKIGKK